MLSLYFVWGPANLKTVHNVQDKIFCWTAYTKLLAPYWYTFGCTLVHIWNFGYFRFWNILVYLWNFGNFWICLLAWNCGE